MGLRSHCCSLSHSLRLLCFLGRLYSSFLSFVPESFKSKMFTYSLTPILCGLTLIRSASALYDHPSPPIHARDLQVRDAERDIVLFRKENTHNATLPIAWGVTNQELFSGTWSPGSGESISLSLTCIDCHTTGNIVASATFPDLSDVAEDVLHPQDIFDESSLALNFQGVGAVVDLDVTATATGDFSIPLFTSESPLGISGPGFQVGLVFSVDLLIGLVGEVDTTGGFEVSIPDGSSFVVPLDDDKPNVANFNGAQTTLLPLTSDTAANVTLALRFKVQAGVDLPDLKVLDAKALAGVFLMLPEIDIQETTNLIGPSNGSCTESLAAEININAGAFIDIGASIEGHEIGEWNPTASTTFWSAGTSTCLAAATGSPTTTPPPTTTGSACPTNLVARSAVNTLAITSCAVDVVNCPNSLAQTIVVEQATITAAASCVPITTAASNTTMTTITTSRGYGNGSYPTSPYGKRYPMPTPIAIREEGDALTIPFTSLANPITQNLPALPDITVVPVITGQPIA
ncbi:hypothetical protein GGR57DRAFT_406504 [Xylariaceae sp. FL1272]|nr:hypothetical protein GGR57DRAFT_406504 [Xylariaceae sp. FL1272]